MSEEETCCLADADADMDIPSPRSPSSGEPYAAEHMIIMHTASYLRLYCSKEEESAIISVIDDAIDLFVSNVSTPMSMIMTRSTMRAANLLRTEFRSEFKHANTKGIDHPK